MSTLSARILEVRSKSVLLAKNRFDKKEDETHGKVVVLEILNAKRRNRIKSTVVF